ncbi:MAG: hypothetical protein ABW019_08545, partial [Chitinophagaceae bacterium]
KIQTAGYMLKRTKGRFLLTLLVITGLAGTLKNTTLTQPERKLAVSELKKGKDRMLQSVKGLSEAQLSFKPAGQQQSIRDCMNQLVLAEQLLWQNLETTMKQPSADEPQGRKLGDREVLAQAEGNYPDLLQLQAATGHKQPAAGLTSFRTLRTEHIRYTRSTTEDLRDHFLQLPFGKIDAYQFILFIAACTDRYLRQIDQIKNAPGFPRT